MLITELNNNRIASKALMDLETALTDYRKFKGNESIQLNDLILFLSKPSAERTEFYAGYETVNDVVGNRYVRQTIN